MAGKGVLLVCGAGDALLGDLGFGSAVARELKARPEPGIEAMDLGPSPRPRLENVIGADYSGVVLVTALDMGKPSGTVEPMPMKTLRSMLAGAGGTRLGMLAGYLVGIYGDGASAIAVQPADSRTGRGLSPVCAGAVQVVREILRGMASGRSGAER